MYHPTSIFSDITKILSPVLASVKHYHLGSHVCDVTTLIRQLINIQVTSIIIY